MMHRLFAFTAAIVLAATASFAQSPAQGSGAAGVAAWAAANCTPGLCVNPATTANGSFTIELQAVTTVGSQVTYSYEVCQIAGQNALSHWVLGLGQIDCLAPGMSLNDLVVGATLDGVATSYSIGLDPTTQVDGFKFDAGVPSVGCYTWSLTLDTSVLAGGSTIGSACVLAATKAGNQDIRNAARPVPGYACIEGPTCVPAPAKIGDFVWRDVDCDGVQDMGEPGIAGLHLQLLDQATLSVLATTTTDMNGAWCFTDLAAGDYVVHLDYNQVSYALATPMLGGDTTLDSDFDVAGAYVLVSLAAGEERTDVDAGLCVICPGPPATQISYPCGYDPINDPIITVSDLVPGEPVTLSMQTQFPGSTGFIFYSVGPVTPVAAAGCVFYVDVLNQSNIVLAADFFLDQNGYWESTTTDTLPLAYLGLEVIFQGRVCAPGGIPGPFAPLPDFFSNAVVATIGCP